MTTASRGKPAAVRTVGFGAPDEFGAHVFRVEIPATRDGEVTIVEDYGLQGGEGGRPFEETRVFLPRDTWTPLAEAARRDFNERLKARGLAPGRWSAGRTLVDRMLGKELCVLAWAVETASRDQCRVIAAKWAALRPEERWWLFSQTVAVAGQADDTQRGWRRALFHALSDGEAPERKQKAARRPADDSHDDLFSKL